MKPITDLHFKHHNKEIYIVGSDPTLEDYPDNFLDGKLSTTLHLAYIKFPNATYHYFNERDRFIFLKEKYPEIIKKINIFGYPFYNRSKQVADETIGGAHKNAYYLDLKPYPPNGNSGDIFNEKGPNAMRAMVANAVNATSITYGGHGTCLHPCMYFAIMLGCNPINIIGCNFKNIKGKEHFGEAHKIDHDMRPTTPSFSGYRGTRMTRGLNAIIAGCKDNNIKVNWVSHYDKTTKQVVYINQNPKSNGLPKTKSEFTAI